MDDVWLYPFKESYFKYYLENFHFCFNQSLLQGYLVATVKLNASLSKPDSPQKS